MIDLKDVYITIAGVPQHILGNGFPLASIDIMDDVNVVDILLDF